MDRIKGKVPPSRQCSQFDGYDWAEAGNSEAILTEPDPVERCPLDHITPVAIGIAVRRQARLPSLDVRHSHDHAGSHCSAPENAKA